MQAATASVMALSRQQPARAQLEQGGQRVAQAAEGSIRAEVREALMDGVRLHQYHIEQWQCQEAKWEQQQRLQRAQRPQPADRQMDG